jgi:hypothetical protein
MLPLFDNLFPHTNVTAPAAGATGSGCALLATTAANPFIDRQNPTCVEL